MRIQQQNTSFGAMKINRHQTSELLKDVPLLTAYEAAVSTEKRAIKEKDFLTAQDAVLFQHSIITEGKDSIFSEDETNSVYALTRFGGDSLGHVMSYIRETHRESKEATDDKVMATILEKSSYSKPKEILKVVADFIAGK